VFPSLDESSFPGFRDPVAFDPDWFFPEERREDVAFRRNFMDFGVSATSWCSKRGAADAGRG
jgi:cytochrome P450 family 710 subfamily A protein